MALKLPPGWKHTPTVQAWTCKACDTQHPQRPGTLRSPEGREWPLIGNGSDAKEREMVKAIIAANGKEQR